MDRIDGFTIDAATFGWIGHDLSRPECIVEDADGVLWIADDRSALMRIDRDGTQRRVGAIGGSPNGFALDARGRFWIAEIAGGRVCAMTADGHHEDVLDAFDGAQLGSANFVLADERGRLWITVSTRTEPRSRALRESIPDGYLLRIDDPDRRPWAAVRAAGGFRFTNEVRIDPAGRHLYVAETAAGTITRLPLAEDGSLGAPEPYGPSPLFPGAKVDGIVFDADGNLWVTEISRNAIVVIRPDGTAREVFADPDGTVLRLPTSITFIGPDRRTAVIGSLVMDRLATFVSPVAGLPPSSGSGAPIGGV
jgi:sugar lactone lactonase YvrE